MVDLRVKSIWILNSIAIQYSINLSMRATVNAWFKSAGIMHLKLNKKQFVEE